MHYLVTVPWCAGVIVGWQQEVLENDLYYRVRKDARNMIGPVLIWIVTIPATQIRPNKMSRYLYCHIAYIEENGKLKSGEIPRVFRRDIQRIDRFHRLNFGRLIFESADSILNQKLKANPILSNHKIKLHQSKYYKLINPVPSQLWCKI